MFVPIAIIIMRFFGKVKRKQEMDVMKKVLKILGIVVLVLVVVVAAFFAYAQYKNWKTLNTPILPDGYYKSFAEVFSAGGKLDEYLLR